MNVFKITIKNPQKYTAETTAPDYDTAINNIMKAEKCKRSDIVSVKEFVQIYKVMRVFRNSGRKRSIKRDLTKSEAQEIVKSFPDSQRSMVCFFKQKLCPLQKT